VAEVEVEAVTTEVVEEAIMEVVEDMIEEEVDEVVEDTIEGDGVEVEDMIITGVVEVMMEAEEEVEEGVVGMMGDGVEEGEVVLQIEDGVEVPQAVVVVVETVEDIWELQVHMLLFIMNGILLVKCGSEDWVTRELDLRLKMRSERLALSRISGLLRTLQDLHLLKWR
jgi:hypothetical protein